ncbi:uncharacterized protein LOC105693310 [Athalia rosae]|uniref:uncharacterized protein LOC105693310 n=1 Tax=Athalia rosae TaxID=37344 RepID=UPI0020335E64|nr:uncharacterized protein LOC105693310 [Athalia rosae]
MNLVYPDWLNEEFVLKILRLAEKDDSVKVTSIHLSPATKRGDNYTSLMYRVTAKFKSRNFPSTIKSVVVKHKPDSDCEIELQDIEGRFKAEASMMTDTLVEMNHLLSNEPALSAKAYFWQEKNPVILVLEDLVSKGFRMVNRYEQLDFDHSLLAIRNLARFHASSFALGEINPSAIRRYTSGFFAADQLPVFWQYFEKSLRCLTGIIADMPELGPRYAEKISKLEPHATRKAMEVSTCDPKEFNVLCHGDLWSNNMLYRYDDQGKPIEHIFVDFQLPIYNSPVWDITYFFSTCLPDDGVRQNLLLEYHETLKSTMRRLKCRTATPSLEEFEKKIQERKFLEVAVTLLMLPIILARGDEIKDLNDLEIVSKDFNPPCLRSELFLNILKHRMPVWDEIGLLDIDRNVKNYEV